MNWIVVAAVCFSGPGGTHCAEVATNSVSGVTYEQCLTIANDLKPGVELFLASRFGHVVQVSVDSMACLSRDMSGGQDVPMF